jgi:hypothetical protein
MSSPQDNHDEKGTQEQKHPVAEPGEIGHSGEGAASALAQMISQDEKRRQGTEPHGSAPAA